MDLAEGATINMRCEGGKIILENAATCCKLCQRSDGPLIADGGDCFCAACIARIKAL